MKESENPLPKVLGLRDLVLFNVATVVSTRWMAVAAHAGSGTLVLWALAALLFLIPSALVADRLSRRFPVEGGFYVWTKEAFGEWHGFLAAWFYYINNLFWIPGLLVASVGMLAFSLGQPWTGMAEKPLFILPCALLLLWVVVWLNYIGLRTGKWVDLLGGISAAGVWVLLALTAVITFVRHGSATHFEWIPRFDLQKLNFWSQLAFGMTGLELAPVLSGEIHNPGRTVPRAAWISAALVALVYIGGTGALLITLTPDRVSPVVGVAQGGAQAALFPGLGWVPLTLAALILFSFAGQVGTYLGGCSRLPFVLGIDRLLPAPFARLHPKYKTPYVSMLLLGIGAGLLLVLSQAGETFRAAYQFTVDMSVITLFIPFLYIFGAAWKLRGPNLGELIAPACGLFASVVAICFSFLPTEDVKSVWLFEAKMIGSCVILTWLAHSLFNRARVSKRVPADPENTSSV